MVSPIPCLIFNSYFESFPKSMSKAGQVQSPYLILGYPFFFLYVFYFLKVTCEIAGLLSEKCASVKLCPKKSMVCPVLWLASNSYFERLFSFSGVNKIGRAHV